MFRNTHVSTLYELKHVILSHLGADGPREIRRLTYRIQAVTPDDRLEYRPSWLSEDRHVWITFEVHSRIMQDRFMEFLAEVRHVGGSSGFRPYQLLADPAPINIVPPDYNSDEDSDCDDESSDIRDEDELVPNTPAAGGPRLVLPAPKPIPTLTDVPSFFQQLDINVRHVEDPTMESVDVEYNTDGGVVFIVGHRMPNRKAVLTAPLPNGFAAVTQSPPIAALLNGFAVFFTTADTTVAKHKISYKLEVQTCEQRFHDAAGAPH
ncbi:hypothetical protein PIB30_044656 [Stylosanthes scabra]|uniref:Uncharacterized protein n=1 Tax=Stylosanthes scabra TaxID=79078 RepID=A0ABU6YE98_9FABA|nr:hypothetical protein [Stylosanthes scabra]